MITPSHAPSLLLGYNGSRLPPDAITVFGLVMAGPDNLHRKSIFVEGGFNWKGVFGRPNDIAGIAVAYVQISDSLPISTAFTNPARPGE